MSGNSNVGNSGVYEDGDQRNIPQSEIREAQRNREHPPPSSRRGSSHSKEQKNARSNSSPTDEELSKHDPRAPVFVAISFFGLIILYAFLSFLVYLSPSLLPSFLPSFSSSLVPSVSFLRLVRCSFRSLFLLYRSFRRIVPPDPIHSSSSPYLFKVSVLYFRCIHCARLTFVSII